MTMIDHSETYPGGPVGVLLVHGLGGAPAELKIIAKGLNRAGYTVHCCQLAGHCAGEAELLATNWRDWYASVERAFDALKGQVQSVYAGGLSMGAILALHLAAKRGAELSGLLLYAPTLWYDGWSIPWYRFLLRILIDTPIGRRYRFVEREPYGIKDPKIRRRILAAMERGNSAEAGLLGTPSASLRELWRLVAEIEPELKAITVPALLVHAREDDISSLKNATYLQKNLGGLVDTLILDDSYHIVTIDRQRDVVIERSNSFIAWIESRLARDADNVRVLQSLA
jgi:carboxylesterase